MNKDKLKEELTEISTYEENWDSYGASPFTKEIIDKAKEVIDYLDNEYKDPDIVPSVCGIQLEWENGENALEVYVEGNTDSSISYLKVIGKDMEDWTETYISDISEIDELLEWLYNEV